METVNKSTELLFHCIEHYYKKMARVIKYVAMVLIVMTLPLLLLQVYRSDFNSNWTLICSIVLFGSIAAAAYTFLTARKNKKVRELRNLVDDPDQLISYELIEGDKLCLMGRGGKITIPVIDIAPLEIEDAVLRTFPQLGKPHRSGSRMEDSLSINEVSAMNMEDHNTVSDRTTLQQNAPAIFRPYFCGKFIPQTGKIPYIVGILIVGIITSILGSKGWINIGFFTEGNVYWQYFSIPALAFILILVYAISNDKKLYKLLQEPERIIWVYVENTKESTFGVPSGERSNLVIADVDRTYNLPLYKNREEVLHWISCYCPSAAIGFYYRWEEMYKSNPKDFLKNIHSNDTPE